jgi:hypothetical protein
VQPATWSIESPAVPTLHDICSKLGDTSDPGFESLIKLIDLIFEFSKILPLLLLVSATGLVV